MNEREQVDYGIKLIIKGETSDSYLINWIKVPETELTGSTFQDNQVSILNYRGTEEVIEYVIRFYQ